MARLLTVLALTAGAPDTGQAIENADDSGSHIKIESLELAPEAVKSNLREDRYRQTEEQRNVRLGHAARAFAMIIAGKRVSAEQVFEHHRGAEHAEQRRGPGDRSKARDRKSTRLKSSHIHLSRMP